VHTLDASGHNPCTRPASVTGRQGGHRTNADPASSPLGEDWLRQRGADSVGSVGLSNYFVVTKLGGGDHGVVQLAEQLSIWGQAGSAWWRAASNMQRHSDASPPLNVQQYGRTVAVLWGWAVTILCDYAVVIGNQPVTVGDHQPVWQGTFRTGARESGYIVFFFNVRGLTHAEQGAMVRINGYELGQLDPYPGAGETHRAWYTQILTLEPHKVFHDKPNEMQIEAVRLKAQDTTGTNVFDDFDVRNVVVLFQQAD